MPDAEPMPDAAMVMLKAHHLNSYLGTNYSLDEEADMDELMFEVMFALRRGMNPPPKESYGGK